MMGKCPKFGIFSGETAVTLPETNSSPLQIGHPNRKLVFQSSIFRCELLVSGRVVFGGVFVGCLFCPNTSHLGHEQQDPPRPSILVKSYVSKGMVRLP